MVSLQQAVTLYVELSGAAECADDIHADALSPESGLPSSESPIVGGIPHPGKVCRRSQGSGDPFVELSRTPAMRIVTAVTRPTIVASPG